MQTKFGTLFYRRLQTLLYHRDSTPSNRGIGLLINVKQLLFGIRKLVYQFIMRLFGNQDKQMTLPNN
ncbi:hypothetical protein A4W75_10560 (plasmid) [Latilactobacillus curvatus]|nr:hypothetical protein A4W75_10560 [Latilactobacillus curvatus]